MKKLLLIPALLAGSLAMAKSYDYEVSAIVGQNMTEDSMELDYHIITGLEVQANKFTNLIYPEISMLYSSSEYVNTGTETSIFRIALNGVYEYERFKERIIPTVKLGFGYKAMSEVEDNTDSTSYVNLILGAKIPVYERWAIKAEYAYMVDIQEDRYDQNHAFWAGLSYSFGKTTKKKMETVLDDSTNFFNEGFVEKNEKKPEKTEKEEDLEIFEKVRTPVVVQERKNNTLNDTDNDGVENYLDKCTGTLAGEEVDAYGCKLDTDYDMDGVKDSIDKCIYTPEGAEVYSNGCSIDADADEDGIKDSIDKCIYTPLNAKVYTNGCRIDDDSDGDGIKDSIDECANTPADIKVTTNGCPVVSKKVETTVQPLSPTPNLEKNDTESRYKKLTGLDITFKYKSFDVTRKSAKNIRLLTNLLNENPSYDVKIIGYTDNVGSEKYNKKLSRKRAFKVKELILEDGIAEERIEAVGMGEDDPVADNSTSEGRAKNRRIEIVLIKN